MNAVAINSALYMTILNANSFLKKIPFLLVSVTCNALNSLDSPS